MWTAGRHTYALGFHLNGSRHETRALNRSVARSVSLVPPQEMTGKRSPNFRIVEIAELLGVIH